ncbi:MAG: TonB-dependent receptor [Zunongwangia sp.]|jgi:TonB-linked SusC/RagA family outer membrane protein|uniref:TonB-dependent Receptor Plug domain protein n=2 Tax=Zunongwangia profunda TaxID=398743 RepID=D5BES2_ZUNPS|nr:TonB-dependent receptor [Zunongwangia profunda]ADF50801.1 tonB-dependent Receptor Plug domain protein [Zunongwangia profunda SM-A87]MAO34662.1 TonB-dependent receptor [Zunongwangia sp.]HCV82335.1 TonB-dependent receptor [Zunongwangia profunda]|tara:strand:+ start:3201 stop:6239 length:3039 start_codon:yes stop_codon:yes gene_type:complete
MITQKSVSCLLFVWAICAGSIAYSQTITGTVKDARGPLPGVSISEKGTENGTVSDFDGKYEIDVSSQDVTLVFSYLGYVTREIPWNGENNVEVVLQESTEQLDELVIVGYQSQKESTITGAVSSVNVKQLESRRVPGVTQALQGQVAGVNITQSTGAPGEEVEVRIRGNGTIGNNNPLYIIDGVPSREISFLNPSDIKSMSVLKDAAAASIYGSRAAGGVIVIETKSGSDRSGFQIDYFGGLQKVTNLPNMLNADQYLNTVTTAWNNAGYSGTNPYLADAGRSDFADVDYLDELFELGKTNSVQLSTSGGNEKTNFFLSAGYYGQDGIVVYDNDKFNRLNLRSNINSNVTNRIKVGANVQISYEQQDKISSKGDAPGIIRHAFLRPPIIPVYKNPSDPTYSEEDPFTDLPFYVDPDNFESNKYEYSQNPIALAYFTDNTTRTFKTFGNLFAEYQILSDNSLKFKTNFGADINFGHQKAFNPNYGDDDGQGAEIDSGLGRQNRPTNLSESRYEDMTFTWNNSFMYNKEIGDHDINALAGIEFIKNNSSGINASRQRFDYTEPNFRYLDFGGTDRDIWNGGLAEEWALFSYFGSATYSYQDKYLITANLRADASSRFSKDNRWGYFPSISAGWTISKENFMDNLDWLNQLKLRASWGQLGNQEIPNYAYLTLYRRDADRYLISRYGNPDLKWETTAQVNIGIDFGLYSNKLSGSIDYFEKTTSDILLPISLPKFVGDVSATYLNSGEVQNSGLEFGLSYRNYENPLKFQISGNLSTLKNVVNSLHPNLPYLTGNVTRTQEGHPLNAYYGFVQEGIYQNQTEVSEHLYGTNNPPQQPGDIKFKDLDGNGVINDNDRDFIGNPNPKLSYGLNVSMNYMSFDFNFLFQGVEGVDRYNDLKKIIDYDTRPFNYTDRVLGAWDGEGSTNTIPRVSFTDNGSSRVSDIFVEDASYLRLKNVELGYTFDVEKVGNFRIYTSGQNLLTFTDYSGLDPESTDLIDFGTYPQSLTILFGVHANF